MANVQIGAALNASFAYIPVAWRQAAGIMAASVFAPVVFDIAESFTPGATVLGLARVIVAVCVSTVAVGALFRIGLATDHPGDPNYVVGPAGFQWGSVEWRILGASLALGAVFVIPLVIIFIIWGMGLGATLMGQTDTLQNLRSGSTAERLAALGRVLAGPAGLVTLVIFVPTIVAAIYVGARLTLYNLIAADTGSFSLARAWSLMRGAVLAVIVAGIVLNLIQAALGGVIGFFGGLAAGLVGQVGASGLWGSILGQAAGAAINAPLFVGLELYIYRIQRGEGGDESVAATFA
jgi:hypothetical protein